MSPPPALPLPLQDLHEVVGLGRERLQGLLTEAEQAVVEAILDLDGPEGVLYARLTARRPDHFRVRELGDEAERLCEGLIALGLLGEGAPWGARLAATPVDGLRAWCGVRGLSRQGRRAELVERLARAAPVAAVEPWVHVAHAALVRRLERLALLDKEADRGVLVAERLGHVAWPTYTPTPGPRLFRDRAHLLAWEGLVEAWRAEDLTVDAALAALRDGSAEAPGRLSLRRRLRRAVRHEVEALRRAGAADEALALLDRLDGALGGSSTRRTLLRSRLHEDRGEPRRAFAVLQEAHADADRAGRVALGRSGRRIGRAIRRGWAPDPPLAAPRTRSLALAPAPTDGPRPRWRVDGVELLVEDAVIATLAQAGRQALRCEGGLVRTLAVVLLADALFLPVPGALPVPRLPGPLDLGSPAFAARRPAAVQAMLDDVDAGHAPARLRAGCEALAGCRIAGVSRELSDPEPLLAAAEALGPRGLRAVIEPVLARGFRATGGLPDLLVLPGPTVRLDAHPARLDDGAVLVEVKGPGDTLRDGQRVWIDRLVRAGVPVEVWAVSAAS